MYLSLKGHSARVVFFRTTWVSSVSLNIDSYAFQAINLRQLVGIDMLSENPLMCIYLSIKRTTLICIKYKIIMNIFPLVLFVQIRLVWHAASYSALFKQFFVWYRLNVLINEQRVGKCWTFHQLLETTLSLCRHFNEYFGSNIRTN